MLRRSLLSRGVLSAATLAGPRPARHPDVPRATPSQAVPRLCITRGSKVWEWGALALRERTGAGLGWAAMPGEGARCITSTGPLLAAFEDGRFKGGRTPSKGGRTPFKGGRTLLHQTEEDGQVQSVQDRLETGAEKELTDADGSTPLHSDALRGGGRDASAGWGSLGGEAQGASVSFKNV